MSKAAITAALSPFLGRKSHGNQLRKHVLFWNCTYARTPRQTMWLHGTIEGTGQRMKRSRRASQTEPQEIYWLVLQVQYSHGTRKLYHSRLLDPYCRFLFGRSRRPLFWSSILLRTKFDDLFNRPWRCSNKARFQRPPFDIRQLLNHYRRNFYGSRSHYRTSPTSWSP